MHYAYFVLVPTKDAKTAREAIDHAENWLTSNNFASEGGFYSSSKADWFEMGGRWTGIFTEMRDWYKDFEKKADKMMEKKFPELDSGVRGVWYGDKKKDAKKKEAIEALDKLWKETLPKDNIPYPIGKCPMIRNTEMGIESLKEQSSFDDDAVVMDTQLFNEFKKRYGSPNKWGEGAEYVDIEDFEEGLVRDLDFDYVKDKWVVIVDYHN